MEDYRPMVALNVYLEPYFRKDILNKILESLSKLPEENRKKFIEEVRQHIKISGFRNPLVAPASLIVKYTESLFEKDSRFLHTILETWASMFTEYHSELVKDLKGLGFTFSDNAGVYPDPENAFLEGWPEGLTYAKLEENIRKKSPNIEASKDELSLLTIWLTGFLPGPSATA